MGLVIAVIIGLGVVLVIWEIRRCERVRFRRLEIFLDGQVPGAAADIHILHLSDLHVTGPTAHRLDQIEYLLERNWDFVIVSGDLIDDDSGITPVCRFLSRLSSTHGKYAVLGNHDFYRIPAENPLRWLAAFVMVTILCRPEKFCVANDLDTLVDKLKEQGVELLRNQLAAGGLAGGGRFQVFGIDDPSTGRDDPEPLYQLADPVALRLVVTHSPQRIGLLTPLRPSIVLCGHTHGGQVRLPFWGALATRSDARRRACSGLVKMDGCRVHISPGFGAGRLFPLRFMVPCEVTEIVLEAADPDT